ncbi:helix-turn-helix domain-containing protein [Pseudomonas sp. PD9R]|uniref:helix-turn-helix domain-containing protein n=1 Tax=Pseudomonas sp. PD9R TaxID=2853534 RepID=UPI003524808D
MADQQASHNNSSINDNSRNAQNTRLVSRLRAGSADTFMIMRELNICRPGARICDLRSVGYVIYTQLITLEDEWGRKHPRVAFYTLLAEPQESFARQA